MNGTWEWRDVTILEYDKESARYHVQWMKRPEHTIVMQSFFVTLGNDQKDRKEEETKKTTTHTTTSNTTTNTTSNTTSNSSNTTTHTGVALELEQDIQTPTELPPSTVLPSKWVSRVNLWIPSRETEIQHRTRMKTAKRHRDAYEARARYLAHVQAMAPLVQLPPVSVPSELFQASLARAGIQMETPADLAKMSRTQIRSLAKVTEEVRRIYIDCMDVLHTQDVVTIPLPGLPTGAAGIPPPIRYESESLKILREGGIPLWTLTCGCHEYKGIRAKVPNNSFVLKQDLEPENKQENKNQNDPSTIPEPLPSGYSTLERDACYASPLHLIETYLPCSNPDVLNSMQDVQIQIIHRLQSIDWLWGKTTVAPPEFCFQRSDIRPKALERAITHPWPLLPERAIDEETNQDVVDDPRLLPELPTSLNIFVISQTRQHVNAANLSHAHAEKWLDNIFADGYGIAVDRYADVLAEFEGRLEEGRKKVSVNTLNIPDSPKGIEIPSILLKMVRNVETYNFKKVPRDSFSDRASSKMASNAMKAPFRRGLYVANLIVKDCLKGICYSSLNQLVQLLEENYDLPVIPEMLDLKQKKQRENNIQKEKLEQQNT